jgi:hypothetical protein
MPIPAEVVGRDPAQSGRVLDGVDVTISHGDTGWDDYADGWRVEDAGGDILGTRVLHHPHVEEQPFTRSLSGVDMPDGVAEIVVRTRTNVTGWAEEVSAPIARSPSGE